MNGGAARKKSTEMPKTCRDAEETARQAGVYLQFLEDGAPGKHHEYAADSRAPGGRRLYFSNVAGLRKDLKKLTGENRWKCSGCAKWKATASGRKCAWCHAMRYIKRSRASRR